MVEVLGTPATALDRSREANDDALGRLVQGELALRVLDGHGVPDRGSRCRIVVSASITATGAVIGRVGGAAGGQNSHPGG